MGESKATTEKSTWVRYRHRERPDIEFDVEVSAGDGLTFTRREPISGEMCHRIRTIRNLLYKEEVHQPAYTYMPADRFLETYERAI